MHLKYAFFSENASIPNMSCRSWITIFEMHLERPQIFFWIAIIFLSSLMIADKEYGTVQKLYTILALITVSTMLNFCLIVAREFTSWQH